MMHITYFLPYVAALVMTEAALCDDKTMLVLSGGGDTSMGRGDRVSLMSDLNILRRAASR